MTLFLQLRIWFRRASAGQKALTLGSCLVLLALVVWTAVPSPSRSGSSVAMTGQSQVTSGGAASGAGSTVGSVASVSGASQGPTAPASAGGGARSSSPTPGQASTGSSSAATAGSSASAASPSTSAAKGPPAGSCTKRGTLKVGVVVPTGAGGSINSVIGAPPTSEEEADYAAVFDAVNKAGGVDCYNLVGDYATADLTNPSSASAGCLQFQQDKVFAVLGGFEPLFSDDCVLQARLPTVDELPIPAGAAKQFYPYYFSQDATFQTLYKNFVDAINQMGYFGPAHHFVKLGVFYEDCSPEIHQALLADLAAVGLSGGKVDSYDLGCSSAFASPSADEQAVLKFKTDGVTTATFDDDIADAQNITNIANSQGWKPAWILPDYGEIAVTGSANEHPNATEFNGAVAITAHQSGAKEAGLPLTPDSQKCDQIMTSHGLPGVYQSADAFAGATCTQVWLLVAALQHDPTVSQAGLAAGLQAAGSFPVSYPEGPNTTSTPGTTTGGEYWRPLQYYASCQCWKVTSTIFHPSFP